jgi:integrase
MSVNKVSSYGKDRYRVRYRESGNPNPKTRTFDKKRDADVFDASAKVANHNRQPITRSRGGQTLEAFGVEYVEKYGRVELATKTMAVLRSVWNKHILPALGKYTLDTLVEHPDLIQDFKARMTASGVGKGAVHKALSALSAVLGKAVEWNRIPRNPAQSVRRPSTKRVRPIEPFSPAQVEALRDLMPTQQDRLMIALLAYTGMRPGEVLALTGTDINVNTILVSKALSDGEVGPTKTRRDRSVRLCKPLADDLKGYGPGLLFPRTDGAPWREHDYNNWRKRVFHVATDKLALGTTITVGTGLTRSERFVRPCPYDLRHSFVSLLLAAQENPITIAAEVGNSPKVLLDVYAHIIHELRGQPSVDPEGEIAKARHQRSSIASNQPTIRHAA